MNDTISVGGMNSYFNSIMQSTTKASRTVKTGQGDSVSPMGCKTDFMSAIEKKVDSLTISDAAETERASAVSTKDMTFDEYKQYISEKISSFPFCIDALNDSYSVCISDEGFKAMQSDPEYEKWVLNDLKTAFSTPMPGWARSIGGTKYQVVHYGATKEECHSTSWWTGYQNGNGKKIWEERSEDSFWSHRGERTKIQEQADKKAAAKRQIEKKWQQEAIEKRQVYTDFLNGKAMLQTNNISEFTDMFTMPVDARVSGIISAYETGTFADGGMI